MLKSNGTTKSITRLVVDKVKLLYSSEMFLIQSILFYFYFVVVVQMSGCKFIIKCLTHILSYLRPIFNVT